MPINRKKFYEVYRAHKKKLGPLTQTVVNRMNFLLDKLDEAKEIDTADDYGFYLGEIGRETGFRWEPCREGFCKTDAGSIAAVTKMYRDGRISYNYAKPQKNGKSYFGRGFGQITWPENYVLCGEAIGMGRQLYDNPDLMLDPEIAWKVFYIGCLKGIFTRGKHKLRDWVNENKADFYNARRIVNGLDHAREVADYCQIFSDAIFFITEEEKAAQDIAGLSIEVEPENLT